MSKHSILLSELAHYLNAYLDPNKMSDGSPNGIQVQNVGPITKMATAVSASLEAINKAAEMGAQALIVHHGIIKYNETKTITDMTYKRLGALIKNDIALLAYHLPLDAHREIGNNWLVAQDLQLKNLEPFGDLNGVKIGVMGTLDEPMKAYDFRDMIQQYYNSYANSVDVKDPVSKVAIVSGAAEKFITQAAMAGADCFITGRVDEPIYDLAHELNISFMGLGHYATETVGVHALAVHLQEKFKIPTEFILTDNPY